MDMEEVHAVRKHRRSPRFLILTLFSVLCIYVIPGTANGVYAGSLSPEGKWKTISDKTGKATSIVRIWKKQEKLFGKVEFVIPEEGKDPKPLCHKCEGEKKDQPITGMTILWDLTKNDVGWDGGYILDPNDGKTYSCKIRVVNDGNNLEVRGYIGFSLLGRTQIWQRIETPKK